MRINHSYELIGDSRALQNIRAYVAKIAPTDFNVLVTGETGVGKELVARAIYKGSPRASCDFVAVNCAAIPIELAETELFGYSKGAFTGANYSGKKGYFEVADKGTLFLDEIGSLPIGIQGKLLRTIEDGTLRKIGGEHEDKTDVRIIAADTGQNLYDPKTFRPDLLYRLETIEIGIPPLRERQEDIAPIATYFLKQLSDRYGRTVKINNEALRLLEAYEFPGNVRELQYILIRASILAENSQIMCHDVENVIINQRRKRSTLKCKAQENSPADYRSRRRQIAQDYMSELFRFFKGDVIRTYEFLQSSGYVTLLQEDMGYVFQSTPPRNIQANIETPENELSKAKDHLIAQNDKSLTESQLIDLFRKNNGKGNATAKELGLTYQTLLHRLKKLGYKGTLDFCKKHEI